MPDKLLILLFILFVHTCFAQRPAVEAIYYDTSGIPYKIEQKYTTGDVTTYITHDNRSSFCVKRKIAMNGDTTIIRETYFSITSKLSRLERLQHCETYMVSTIDTRDTAWIKGYATDIISGERQFVADTILTGEAAKYSWDFSQRIKYVRVPAILSGQITVTTDTFVPVETTVGYLLNGIPVRVEILDHHDKMEGMIIGSFSKNKAVYKHYFTTDSIQYFEVDSVSWNSTRALLQWNSRRFEWDKTFESAYEINGPKLTVMSPDGYKEQIRYLDGSSTFQNIFLGELLYNDPPYFLEFRQFDREQVVGITSELKNDRATYSYDGKKRITEQMLYSGGILQKKVMYRYSD